MTFSTPPKPTAPERTRTGRRGAGALPRRGCDRHQVRLQGRRCHGGLDSRPEHIKQVADASLKRLRTDDRPLLPASRRSERADRGRRRRRQGPDRRRARSAISACRKPACQSIRRAHAVQPVTALQSEYSLWWREPESECCRPRGIRHRLRPVQPARQGFSDGRDHVDTTSPPTTSATSCRASRPRPARPTRRWSSCSAQSLREEGNDGADRAGVAAGAKAMDRADPRHDELHRLKENIGAAAVA